MADKSRSSSFFKNLRNSIPWNNGALLDLENEINILNPKFNIFEDKGPKRTEILQKHSITYGTSDSQPLAQVGNANDIPLYANIQENKIGRIKDYRVMAAYPRVSECLDNICNEMINLDDLNNIIKLDLDKADLQDEHKDELEKEFKEFVEIFDLEQNGWDYCRRLLVEGELFFEHIIDKNEPGWGILGVVPIPTELIDPIYDNMQNFMVRGFLERKPVLDPKNPSKISDWELIPLQKNQVTYINSGIWNEDKTFRLPYIENARRAYRELSLIEDSIIIYRLVRAPERLIFNIDVGTMPPAQAESYLRTLMNNYWNSKTFDIANGGIMQKFNPQSMLDAFWFPKRKGSEGSSVSTLPAGANLDKLEDLFYFVDALYTSLGVPTNRNKPDDKAPTQSSDILRQELKFARLVIRLQKLLASGIKQSFITHLKLKLYHGSEKNNNWWKEFNLSDNEIRIKLNPPSNYYQLRETQKLELAMNLFNTAKSTDFISPSLAAKDYLHWDDNRLKANMEWKRKDKAFEWELTQILNMGPNWKEAINAQNQNIDNGGASTGGSLGGSGLPPMDMDNPSADNGGTGGADDQTPPDFGGTATVNEPVQTEQPIA